MPIALLPPPREVSTAPQNLFARRAGAYFLDLGALYVFTVGSSFLCLYLYATFTRPDDPGALAELAASNRAMSFTKACHVLYYFSYFTISHWYFGRTAGKWAMKLRVRPVTGEELSIFRSLYRSLLYVVSGQLALGVGFLLPLFRHDGQTLHDLIAGTRVSMDSENAQGKTQSLRAA